MIDSHLTILTCTRHLIRRLDSREVFGEIVGNGTRGEVKVFWHGAHADGSSFA